MTLESAVAQALANNRGLAVSRLDRGIAQARASVARERPNPDLALGVTKETPKESAELSLPLELGGRRSQRIALANREIETGESDLGRNRLFLRTATRRAYYAVVAAERQKAEAQALAGLAGRTRDAARDRFESGAAPRLELLQAELLVSEAESEVTGSKGDLLAAQVGLNLLMARRPEEPLVLSGSLSDGSIPEEQAAIDLAGAVNADLTVLDHEIEEARARVNLARSMMFPDTAVMAGVTHDSPPEFQWGWRAGLSITLPVFSRHRAGVVVEELSLARLGAQREARQFEIAGEVISAQRLVASRREQGERFENEILPRAGEVSNMAEESYRAGQTDLVALLQTLQTVRDIRLKAVQAWLDYQTALADLEEAIGAPLP